MGIFSRKNKIEKVIAESNESITAQNLTAPLNGRGDENRRGLQVYTMSQLMGISGRAQDGSIIQGYVDQPIFYLSIDERLGIFRLCSPVNAVVTSRMNRISALKYKVVCDKQNEDKIVEHLKTLRGIAKEYDAVPDLQYKIAAAKLRMQIKETLIDLLPDMSNFDSSLLRWSRKIKMMSNDRAQEIEAWLAEPNAEDNWIDFIKKYIFDLMVHGAVALYKESMDNLVENIYVLPGGSVIPLKSKFVGGAQAYVQLLQGYQDPQIFFNNELSYVNYIPVSARGYGFIPLEALVNKVCETMLFDKLMADQADGTKPPEKMVIIADSSPFGDLSKEFNVPLNPEEQRRIETKLNQPKKGAIMTFTGNTVQVVDLSRENTMGIQTQRQKDIREEVAMVFHASALEMNLGGGENTSGRSTADAQAEIMSERGILPIVRTIETQFNREILPFRFGTGYKLEFDTDRGEREQLELERMKMDTGTYSINEIRKLRNDDPFDGEEYDKPAGGPQQPTGEEQSPIFTKTVQ